MHIYIYIERERDRYMYANVLCKRVPSSRAHDLRCAPPGVQHAPANQQEVRGVHRGLGGSSVSPFQASGGISTLQSRASGLQSTTQGIPSAPQDSSASRRKQTCNEHDGSNDQDNMFAFLMNSSVS